MIMINHKCSWKFPDGIIHNQIARALTTVSTGMRFVRPFSAVDCSTDLAWWWLKIMGFSFLYYFPFSFISPLPTPDGSFMFRCRSTSHHP